MKYRWILATLAIFVLAAVPPAQAAHVNVYNAAFQLDTTQEVPGPPAPGRALGSCVAILDLEASSLELSCTHNVADATAAHIHFGDRGEAGPIVFPLGDGASPILFETPVTDDQIAAFVTGNYYVNVHNAANPQGIVRGQIEFDAQEDASSLTVGDLRDGPSCRAVLSRRTGSPDVRLTCVTDLAPIAPTDLTAVEIREDGGGVVAAFEDLDDLNQVFELSEAEADLLRDGDLNVVFETATDSVVLPLDGCFADGRTLCLNDNRFQVTVRGSAPNGDGGFNEFVGRAFPRSDTSGEFSFFTPDNLEILIKVLDGCAVNNHYWVFFSALTNVAFTVEVADTLGGITRTYDNPQGMVARPVTDTAAFMTCPATVITDSTRSFDDTVAALTAAIGASPAQVVTVIDHAAAAEGAGLDLPPTTLVIFGNPNLGTPLMRINRTVGIDLPQKFLVWQTGDTVKVAYNSVEYLRARHDLGDAPALEMIRGALKSFAEAATGNTVADDAFGPVPLQAGTGLVTLTSPDDVDTTLARLLDAIEASPAQVALNLSHDANAQSAGLMLPPTDLVVFGNPNLGTPLMQASRTMGIDLPLKFLVWQDGDGSTRVTYNDIYYLARRHHVRGRDSVLQTIADALETFASAATGDGN